MNPDTLFADLLPIVGEVSAADFVQFKFPQWKPTGNTQAKDRPKATALRRDEIKPVDQFRWKTVIHQNEHLYPRAKALLAEKEAMLARVVRRDPCFKCGVRADIGCRHQ
jgi:hypothetical protein